MDNECPICCDTYTSQQRRRITCRECNFIACLNCFKSHLLKSEEFNPACMNTGCDKTYTFSEIQELTGNNKAFDKHVLAKFAEIDFRYEESQLVHTQQAAKKEKELRHMQMENRKVAQEIEALTNMIAGLRHNINSRYAAFYRKWNSNKKQEKNEYTFIKKCSHDGCEGFLSKKWKCGVCSEYTCHRCHEPLQSHDDPNHVCDEDTVKNIESMVNDTRPCPQCGTGIFKISGCDQMYCISCHTAFSWRTGKIMTGGVIHNPEYFRFRRENETNLPRRAAIGDLNIDNCFDPFAPETFRDYMHVWEYFTWGSTRLKYACSEIYRFGLHMRDVVNNNEDINRIQRKKEELRIGYLLKDFPKDHWERENKKMVKKSYYQQEKRKIDQTLLNITKDVIINMFIISQGENKINRWIEQHNNFLIWFDKMDKEYSKLARSYSYTHRNPNTIRMIEWTFGEEKHKLINRIDTR